MADHLSDEEQLQLLKNWWTDNGRFIVSAVVVVAAAYFGWQWWKQYQIDYAVGASNLYTELSETVASANGAALNEEQNKTAQYLIKQLKDEYSKSLYSANAALLAAKLFVDENELESAESALREVLSFDDNNIKAIAGLRLAKVLFAQQKFDQALDAANYDNKNAYTSAYAAIKGDILVAKGDAELARDAYQTALDNLTAGNNIEKSLIEIKLAELPKVGDQS